MKWYIGGGVYVFFYFGYFIVDIRYFWKLEDVVDLVLIRKGVILNKQKLIRLFEVVQEV